MEQLIGIIIFAIIAGIGQWLQKRAERQDQTEDADWDPLPRKPQPPRVPPPPPGRPIRWQDELKKQLEERSIPRPVVFDRGKLQGPQTSQHQSVPPALPLQRELSEGDLVFKSPLHAVEDNRVRAAAMQAQLEARMNQVGSRDLLHPPRKISKKRTPRDEIQRALKLTKSAGGMRQAFIASVILGAPRALQSADNPSQGT